MRTVPEGSAAVADPLVIRDLEFLGGMASPDGWRPQSALPEIAFGGRSNVGKSSLLNRLVRRKALARVSQTPGKTISRLPTKEAIWLRLTLATVTAKL